MADANPYASAFHIPVLCHTVLEYLVTDTNGTYVDATAGGGGHTAAILDRLKPSGRVVAIDRDIDAIDQVRQRCADAIRDGQLYLCHGRFGNLAKLVDTSGPVAGVLMDLGVSSHQVDIGPRGFSHRFDASLDMRMDRRDAVTAAQVVNDYSESALRELLIEYGEEPRARRIARAVTSARPLETTHALASVVRRAVPTKAEARSVARVFQAIRIEVNAELDELTCVLRRVHELVRFGGRIVIISYHSLEDRLVKRTLREGTPTGTAERNIYGFVQSPWKALTRKPVMASESEIARNSRARSARLRAGIRCQTPDRKHVEQQHGKI